MTEKISKSSALIEEYIGQKHSFEQKLRSIKTNESYNPLGVNLENNLMIEVNEIFGFAKSDSQFFIVLNCGAQKFKTQRIKALGISHRINEIFNGKIEHGTENIHVKLVRVRPQGEEVVGQQMIHIEELSDQLKHDFNLALIGDNGGETPIRLSLSIQWIHSKVEIY